MGVVQDHRSLAEELARYSQLCYSRGLVGAAGGNLSVRVPDEDIFLVTVSGVALRDVTAENIVAVDLQGKVLQAPPGLRPSKEVKFHLAVFQTRPSVNAVLHVHPPYTVIHATAERTIPLATISAMLKLKQGDIVGPADPGSQELRQKVLEAVRNAGPDISVLLMASHGLLSFDESLSRAFDDAELAEDTAKIAYLQSNWLAQPVHLEALSDKRIVDLSAPLGENTYAYPSDPQYSKTWHATLERDGLNVSKVQMGLHCGSHVDAPLHFIADAPDVLQMPLERFFGPAVAIDCPKQAGQDILAKDLAGTDICPGDIVLFRTGWEERSGSAEFFEGQWPGLSVEVVQALIASGVRAVGGDIVSADSPAAITAGAPVHNKALAAGMPIFEGLINLGCVVNKRFFFIALPLAIVAGEASPVRAMALLDPEA